MVKESLQMACMCNILRVVVWKWELSPRSRKILSLNAPASIFAFQSTQASSHSPETCLLG